MIPSELWAHVVSARWFAGKSRSPKPGAHEPLPWYPGSRVRSELLRIDYPDGDSEWYQLALEYTDEATSQTIAETSHGFVQDATATESGRTALLSTFTHPVAGERLQVHGAVAASGGLRSRRFAGEQSNTSVFFGDRYMLKLFRRLERGRNLDIELHEALSDTGLVARLYGWIAADPFDLALGTETRDGADLAGLFSGRARAIAAQVKALKPLLPEVLRHFEGCAGDHVVQRIHGDFHLGQTLKTSVGWRFVDFEGEPMKPLAERRSLDSAWRDVAGMLRSIDYAAVIGGSDSAWRDETRAAFLSAYCDGQGEEPGPLLGAYELDRAIYELHYEVRNRPELVDVPMRFLHETLDQ